MQNRKNENTPNAAAMIDYAEALPLLQTRHLPLSLRIMRDYLSGRVAPPRLLNNLAMADLMPKLDGKIIEIGAIPPGHKRFANPNTEYVLSNISKEQGSVYLDAMNMSLADNSVDNFVCASVLEHVPQPWKVISEIHRTLKPGGKLLLVVPFVFPFHGAPRDFFRFSHKGLAVMLEKFNVIHAEALGNIFSTCALFLQRPFGWSSLSYRQGHRLVQIMKTVARNSILLLFRTMGLFFYFLSFTIRNPDDYAFLYCLLVEKRES